MHQSGLSSIHTLAPANSAWIVHANCQRPDSPLLTSLHAQHNAVPVGAKMVSVLFCPCMAWTSPSSPACSYSFFRGRNWGFRVNSAASVVNTSPAHDRAQVKAQQR